MAHVHGAAGAIKAAGKAGEMAKGAAEGAMKAGGMAKGAMDHAMMGHAAGEAMGGMMGAGQMGGGMMGAGHMMADMPMMVHGSGQLVKGVAKGAMTGGAMGAAMATTSHNTGGFMSSLAKHPWLVFGLGVAAGVLIYKYRKEIIGATTEAAEKGKDFVLQQKENLEDLVAECCECEETAAKPKAE